MRNISILAAALILAGGTALAQDNIYLVKGDKVVATYSSDQVDYITFENPTPQADITIDSNFADYRFFGEYVADSGVDNVTLNLGTAQHQGMTITGAGSYLMLSINIPPVEDVAHPGVATGHWDFNKYSDVLPWTITAESRYLTYEPKADGTDGFQTVEDQFVVGGSLDIALTGTGYDINADLQLADGRTVGAFYHGTVGVENVLEKLIPTQITSDVDFESTFVNIVTDGTGVYSVDMMTGTNPYEEEWPEWGNRQRVDMVAWAPADATGLPAGSYTITPNLADFVVAPGGYTITGGHSEPYGSQYYYSGDDPSIEKANAFLKTGTLTVERASDNSYHIYLDAVDLNGHKVTTDYIGIPRFKNTAATSDSTEMPRHRMTRLPLAR